MRDVHGWLGPVITYDSGRITRDFYSCESKAEAIREVIRLGGGDRLVGVLKNAYTPQELFYPAAGGAPFFYVGDRYVGIWYRSRRSADMLP